jgi:C-terminal processing protease CtpA/Prc
MESLNTKIRNVLKESWMKKRSETLKNVRKSKGEESEKMVPKEDTREVFRNTVMKHMDDLHTKFLNDENLHPEVRQEIESHIKRLGQTLSKF